MHNLLSHYIFYQLFLSLIFNRGEHSLVFYMVCFLSQIRDISNTKCSFCAFGLVSMSEILFLLHFIVLTVF